MFRCRPTVRNRGQFSLAKRPAVTIPSSMVPVSSSSVTSPVARVAYQRAGPLRAVPNDIAGQPPPDPPEVVAGGGGGGGAGAAGAGAGAAGGGGGGGAAAGGAA